MPIPTSRTQECGQITIDEIRCNGCGLCVSVCKNFSLIMENKKAKMAQNPLFGCLACGHCMMICPQEAITIDGRCASKEDLLKMPSKEESASYNELLNLLYRRRSIREFKDIPVEKELIDKVIEAAQTAPMGLPPSDVHLLVLDSKEKVSAFARDFCFYLEGLKWFVSKWFMTLMRPIYGKEKTDFFKAFIRPCVNAYTEFMRKEINIVNYDAPVAIYFYGSPYSDPADPLIAATYAMMAAESLGLGTCFNGAVHPFIQNGKAAERFRMKHGIRHKSQGGIFLLLGYPEVKYGKTIKRSFAAVDWK